MCCSSESYPLCVCVRRATSSMFLHSEICLPRLWCAEWVHVNVFSQDEFEEANFVGQLMVKFYGVGCIVTSLLCAFVACCSGLYLQIDELFEYVEEDVEEDPANEAEFLFRVTTDLQQTSGCYGYSIFCFCCSIPKRCRVRKCSSCVGTDAV